MAVEEHVKGIMTTKIISTDGYPNIQDRTSKDGVTWYKEESYQNRNPQIESMLSTATKSLTGAAPGTPDFVIDTPSFYIVIEAKGIEKRNKHKHSRFDDVTKYIKPNATRNDQVYDTECIKNRECAIDEALFYSTFMNEHKDVIAIAVSGTENDRDFKFTSFLLPQGKLLNSIVLIENGGLNGTFNTVENYKREIYKAYGYEEKLYRAVYEDLRKYADAAAKFLNTNGVDENDRLGLVSAIVLALTNKNSDLFKKVSTNSKLDVSPAEIKNSLLSESVPLGVIIEDELPAEKRNTLKAYFNALLDKPFLTRKIKIKDNKEVNTKDYFEINKGFADSIISRLTYSLYEFIVKIYNRYQDSNIDVMGSFYSLFLQYAKADVKKGVVLTPKHVTQLFCDLAEYYLGKKITHKTKVLDICTGSGGFLIAALNRMDQNIENDKSLNRQEKENAKEIARKNCLLGIELKDTMFVLAYANMRFHKDGKSSLYHGSSLYSDKEVLSDNKNFEQILAQAYQGVEELSDIEKVEMCGPEIGMMNPPYEEDVFEFIDSMLMYLRKGGIGIAIVPINTQSTNDEVTSKKNKLLENNTLLASILMPSDLFNGVRGSGAATSTCILVFKAHFPHKDYVNNGGLTYLADWSVDGFKLVPKHGRFEINDAWNDPLNGYKALYLSDLMKIKQEDEFILSSNYKKDIHKDGSIKSIRKRIHLFDHIEREIKKDKDGNIIYKKNKTVKVDSNGNPKLNKKGQIQYMNVEALDINGEKIPEVKETEIYINEDWNILEYVKTDYNDLKEDDFIKNMLDFNLYVYMKENGLLFEEEDEA